MLTESIWCALQAELSGTTISVLQRLAALFSLSLMEKQAGEFLEDGYLSGMQGSCSWWPKRLSCVLPMQVL